MKRLLIALTAIIGGMVVLPSAAFADSPWQGPAPYAPATTTTSATTTTTTTTVQCAGVTPQDTVTSVSLEVTVTTRTWSSPLPPDTGSVSSSVTRGVARVSAPDGQSGWYFLHYRSLQQIGGPTFVTGRDLLGGGAMSDLLYLEGGTATVADDGSAGVTSGNWIDVCAALGA